MSDTDYFAKYRAYFVSQKDRAPLGTTAHLPFVTLSRQAGAGAETVARVLAEKLNANLPKDAQPWTVFDKNLVAKMLEDADLPQELPGLSSKTRTPLCRPSSARCSVSIPQCGPSSTIRVTPSSKWRGSDAALLSDEAPKSSLQG